MRFSFVKVIILIVLIAVLIKQIYFLSTSNIFGQRDLIAFWSGVQAFISKTNPYAALELFDIQKEIYPAIENVKWFLNPAWALPFLTPFFYSSFDTVLTIWPLINLIMWVCIILFIYFIKFRNQLIVPFIVLFIFLSFLYIPLYLVLIFGQLDILILFFFYAALWCLIKKQDVLFGFLIFPVTLKPQLFFLFLFCLILWLIKEKRYPAIIASFFFFSLFNLTAYIYYPEIFNHWLQMEYSPTLLQTSTLASQLRLLLYDLTDTHYFYPVVIFPLMGIIFITIWFYQKSWNLDLKQDTGFLLAMSIIFTPYAWPYDFIMLFPIFIEIIFSFQNISKPYFRHFIFPVLAFLSQLMLFIGWSWSVLNDLGDYFWYPPLTLSIYILFKHQNSVTKTE